jgi:proteic killer suppression protein
VIRSFRDGDTEAVFNSNRVARFVTIEKVAIRRLFQLAAATSLQDLRGPSLHLEKLTGNRKGQHSIRINLKWRICFVWNDGNAHEVEITDYH